MKRNRRTCVGGLLFVVLLSGRGLCQDEPEPGDRQAVFETSEGTFVLDLFPKEAPRHVAAFRRKVQEGFYVGTVFHRAVPLGIIQGGDPLSRDPAQRDRYGTGGLFELKREPNNLSHLRGTVSAVLVPGQPDSAGSQFFICVSDQISLDGQYTGFGTVAEGMEVVERISQLPADSQQRLLSRIEVLRTYERDRPPPEKVPFESATVEEMSRYRAVITTDLGDFEISFHPEDAPEHVRQFLKFAALGLYDGTTFHRIVPGFVIQGGSMLHRKPPVPEKYFRLLRPLKAEFNERLHVRGVVSMARTDDPDSAIDSFFIVLEPQPSLDGLYTVFGHVTRGIDTVDGISQMPVRGETPIVPFPIRKVALLEAGSH